MTLAEVKLWGRTIGAVSLEDGERFAAFQYDPAFAQSGIEVSPITMPLERPGVCLSGFAANNFSRSARSAGRFVARPVRQRPD